jgi:hypothetical protein
MEGRVFLRNSPVGHAFVQQSHVALPEVGDNLDLLSARCGTEVSVIH